MLEVSVILVLILVNALLAASEISVVSSRRVRLEQAAERGDRGSRNALVLADNPTRFLSTVQVGITLIGIVSGAFGGTAVATRLAPVVARVEVLQPYADGIALGLVVVVITYLSLVVGELVPKRLAMNNPEGVARVIAGPMRALSLLSAPVVRLLSASTDLVVGAMGGRHASSEAVTEEEVRGLIEKGAQTGVFEAGERELVERVFQLGDQRVTGLMVPRSGIVWLDVDDDPAANERTVRESGHSHFPVCKGSVDKILGVAHIKDLIAAGMGSGPFDLAKVARPPQFVPEAMPVLRLLERFRESGSHVAFVIDEYGGVEGLVTLNDVAEALVGEIGRSGAVPEPLVVRREDGSYLVDGMTGVAEVKRLLELDDLPENVGGYVQTLGGLVAAHLGRIPRSADAFVWGPWRVEVVDMDRQRVDKVLIAPAPRPAGEPAPDA